MVAVAVALEDGKVVDLPEDGMVDLLEDGKVMDLLEDGKVATADLLEDGKVMDLLEDGKVATADHLDLEDGKGKVMDLLEAATAVATADHMALDGKVMDLLEDGKVAKADHLALEDGNQDRGTLQVTTPLLEVQDQRNGTGAQERKSWRSVRENLVLALTNLAWSASEEMDRDDDDDQVRAPPPPGPGPAGHWQWHPVTWQDVGFCCFFHVFSCFVFFISGFWRRFNLLTSAITLAGSYGIW